jgi:hypothetical protein
MTGEDSCNVGELAAQGPTGQTTAALLIKMPNLAQLGGDPGHRVGDTALTFRSVSRYPR